LFLKLNQTIVLLVLKLLFTPSSSIVDIEFLIQVFITVVTLFILILSNDLCLVLTFENAVAVVEVLCSVFFVEALVENVLRNLDFFIVFHDFSTEDFVFDCSAVFEFLLINFEYFFVSYNLTD